jgi:hypothetical protein
MDEHEKLERARRRVEDLMGFYIHLAVFVVVMAILLVVNIVNSPPWWVQWPFLGWGLGLLGHGIAIFGKLPNFVTRWQLRKIRDLSARM